MLGFLFAFLANPLFWVLGVCTVALVFLAVRMGHKDLVLKIITDGRVWLAIVAALFFMSISHIQKENAELKQQVIELQNQATADKDATKTDATRAKQKQKRQAETEKNQTIIENAQPGQAQDDLLDELAANRPDLNGGSSTSADGLRKHPDGVVVP